MLQVLIVEDLPANRAVAVFHLQKLGCQTQTAEDGQEALERCQEQRFDLVFMDLEMPRMNGHYALKNLRENNNPNNLTPIVALTADQDEEKKEICQQEGFNDIITKPISRDQLQRALDRWIL